MYRFLPLDRRKAFDIFEHDYILLKWKTYAVRAVRVELFRSFLKGRTRRTSIKNKLSDTAVMIYDLPHGLFLGPIINQKLISFCDTTLVLTTQVDRTYSPSMIIL